MNTTALNQIHHLVRPNAAPKSLAQGSSVLVRVIADKGNGKYEGSVAGARITLNSKSPLKPGSTFVATITSQNGSVRLVPLQENIQVETQIPQVKLLQAEQLSFLLQQLGLPQDQLSEELLKQFKQLNLAFNSPTLQRLQRLAVRFNGKEKLAAQLLSVLLKKGLNASEDELQALISELENQCSEEPGSDVQQNYEQINRINKEKGSWRFLPYELLNLQDNSVIGKGCLKILENQNGSLNLLNMNCLISSKTYSFCLKYENHSLKKVFVNIEPCSDSETLLSLLKDRFIKLNPLVKVFWTPKDTLEGTAASLEELFTFYGEV